MSDSADDFNEWWRSTAALYRLRIIAQEAWQAATLIERKRCAKVARALGDDWIADNIFDPDYSPPPPEQDQHHVHDAGE